MSEIYKQTNLILSQILTELQEMRKIFLRDEESKDYYIYELSLSNTPLVYIGMTSNIDRRIRQHKQHLKNGIHFNKALQYLYDKGRRVSFKVLLRTQGKQLALQLEKSTIDEYTAKNRCLNNLSVDDIRKQEEVRQDDPWESFIEEYLRKQQREYVKISDICLKVLDIPLKHIDNVTRNRVAEILKGLGWIKKVKKLHKTTTTIYTPPDDFYDGTEPLVCDEEYDDIRITNILQRIQ